MANTTTIASPVVQQTIVIFAGTIVLLGAAFPATTHLGVPAGTLLVAITAAAFGFTVGGLFKDESADDSDPDTSQ